MCLTCDVSVRDTFPRCIAGGHFSGVGVKVGQLAGEPRGVANLDWVGPRHAVDCVPRGKQ